MVNTVGITFLAVMFTWVGATSNAMPKSSRACFGNVGQNCTRHTLGPCEHNLTIEIIDAYFIGNTNCSLGGITNCRGLNLTDTHGSRQNLSKTQIDKFNVCLCKSSCNVYPAPRPKGTGNAVSVIVYICTEGRSTTSIRSTESTTTAFPASVNADRGNVGAVVGGVVAAVAVVVIIVLVSVWYFRKRQSRETRCEKVDDQRQTKQSAKSDSVYTLAGNENLKQNQYSEICLESSMKKSHIDGNPVQEYTYDVVNKPQKQTAKNSGLNVDSSDYDIAGDVENKPVSQHVEDTYDHTPSTGNVNFQAGRTTTDTYDTALTSSESVNNTNTHGESNYNHISLANAKKELVMSNDYDTTAGALKYGQDESDYDHAHANGEVVTRDLDYDTTDNVQGVLSSV